MRKEIAMIRPNKPRAGFTLVELLVVIGIIAILIGFLLPALNKARRAGVTTACLSQLRQIGIGINIYATESKGWFPSCGPNRDFRLKPGAISLSWPERIVMSGAIKQTLPTGWSYTDPQGSRQYPHAGKGVFLCPGFAQGADEGGTDRPGARGYAYNPFVSPDFPGIPPADWLASFTKIQRLPKGKVVMVDGYMRLYGLLDTDYVRTNSGPFRNSQGVMRNLGGPNEYGIYLRHNNGANYLFTDMHAEWSNFYHRTGNATPGNVWAINQSIFIPVREITAGD
jgi:prepilin-type N-terminal cleavage/methylation domain-containing protein/prepilin-type processing-associated H-X9-DG protein